MNFSWRGGSRQSLARAHRQELHRATGAHCRHFNCFDQVRESLLLEVRLLRETLREAQGDIERCRYFSSEMTRREAEITQRADAKVQQ